MQSIQVPAAPTGPTSNHEPDGQEVAPERDFITSFNRRLHEAQEVAIATLHDLLLESAQPAAPRTAPMPPDEFRHAKLDAQRRSLRYRAATVLLRVRPLKDPTAATPRRPLLEEGRRRDRMKVLQSCGAGSQPASSAQTEREPTPPGCQDANHHPTELKPHAPSPSRLVAAAAGTTTQSPSRRAESPSLSSHHQQERQQHNHQQAAEAAA